MLIEHFDVLIIGSGLAGIGAACILQRSCPLKRFAILEAREELGGTWDLFRYPGVRSDSDMYTLGYSFRPWSGSSELASGSAILRYLRETAAEHAVDRHIRYQHRVRRVSWSSSAACWSVEVERGSRRQPVRFTCNFLFTCTGYYDHDAGYLPDLPGRAQFTGTWVQPQTWPQSLDCSGKRVVVIGSGATAVTLVPALAGNAAHVTMLQRSPCYILSPPNRNPAIEWLQRRLPARLANLLIRWRYILIRQGLFHLCRSYPAMMRRYFRRGLRQALGPEYDLDAHFTPRYDPWEQRLCLAPDGDLFEAVRLGKASICTGEIDTFTARGLRLRDGRELTADVVVTATGLNFAWLRDIEIVVDGRVIDLAHTTRYKGSMFSTIPNLAAAFGYSNSSWTLRCELTARFVCRLLRYMDRRGYRVCMPVLEDAATATRSWIALSSGYIERARHQLPLAGSRGPWKVRQNYLLDLMALRLNPVADDALHFA